MKELLLGTWGPQLLAYCQQYPAHVAIGAMSAVSIVIILTFGRLSWSGDGTDLSGFGVGDSEGDGCGD
jgi:hypothetical protein